MAHRTRRARTGDAEGSGLFARALERTLENPATAGGLLVMALTATAIVSNALLLQGPHDPGGIFGWGAAEQSPAGTPSEHVIVDPPIPRLAPRTISMTPSTQDVAPVPVPPLPAPPLAEAIPPVPPAPIDAQVVLVSSVQRELARIGLYNGAIDGVAGSRTETAIRAFEQAAGLHVTGSATAELLAALKQPIAPRPAPTVTAVGTQADAEAVELNRREQERARLIEAEQQRQATLRATDTYRIVQTALNRIGYGPIPVDGNDGSETHDAIRRFELDNGMPVTGEANDALIARLVAIGAIKPG